MISYFKYFLKYKLSILIVVFSIIITVGSTLLGPIYIGKAINEITNNGPQLLKILIITAVIYIINAMFLWLATYVTNYAAEKAGADIRNKLYKKLFTLKDNYFYKNSEGNIANCFTNDIETLSQGAVLSVSTILIGVATVVFASIIICYLNLTLAVVILISAPICLLVANLITKNMQKYFKKQAKQLARINEFSLENIANQDLIKSYNHSDKSVLNFVEENEKLRKYSQKSMLFSSLVNPTTRIVNNIVYCLIAFVGCLIVLSNKMDVGLLSTFLLYGNIFLKPVNEITGAVASVSSAKASYNRINIVLQEDDEALTSGKTIKEIKGKIEFRNLCFSFNAEKEIFKDFSFVINKGETIAVTGKTGSGKTTLVNLLLKFLKQDSGEILLDGVDISLLDNTFLRKTIGIVQQEPFIYTGSIYYNIGFGADEIDEQLVRQTAKKLYADDFIKTLPNGYNTIVSSDTGLLSQGQKQLITICRVMYYNPKILVLDEATSAIDLQSQRLIDNAINKLKQGKTTLIIAHNEDTIRNADRELVVGSNN